MRIIHKPAQLLELLEYSQEDIDEVIIRIKQHPRSLYYSYIKNSIKDGKKKSRPIDPSRVELRDIQNKIKDKILSTIPMPLHINGSTRGRNNIINAAAHRGNKFHFQTDLTNFFGFVTNKGVFESLRKYGFSPSVCNLITRLTTFKGHLPQGTPTSPFLANIVGLQILDKPLLNLCEQHKIKYTRYVDDLWFSSNSNFKYLESEILKIIIESGFLFSHSKTIGKVGKIEGTGCLLKTNGRLSITNKQNQKLNDPNLSEKSRKGLVSYKNKVEKTKKAPPGRLQYSEKELFSCSASMALPASASLHSLPAR